MRAKEKTHRAQNELYVWFTDDELLKMKGYKVLVEVEISDIFTNGLCYSTIETINVDPIVRKRCTYSTSFNNNVVNDLRSIEKFIKLAKKQGFATELSTNFGGQITVITIRGISFHDAMALEKLVED